MRTAAAHDADAVSPMSTLARSLIGWAVLCLGVGLSITLTRLAGPVTTDSPLTERAVQAVIVGALAIPPLFALRHRLGEGAGRQKPSPSFAWMHPAAIAAAVGLGAAAVTWAPAVLAGWVQLTGVSIPQLLIFLAVNTLIALLYEALPEELALRGYAWESLRQRFRPIIATAVVTGLFCATYTGISAVQTGSALLLGVRADGIAPAPDGTDPVAYLLQISLFGLALIAARSLPAPGALAAAISFHLVHLTVNRLLFGGLGGFDTGVEVSVAPGTEVLVLVHIVLSGLAFALLRKTIRRRDGAQSPPSSVAGATTAPDQPKWHRHRLALELTSNYFGHMPKSNDQVTYRSPSGERGRRVRQLLMKSARELIVEVGWNSVTTRRLAERAGVRPGLVHYHFDSLADALRKAAISEVTRFVDAQLDIHGSIAGAERSDILQTIPVDFEDSDSMPILMIETYLAAVRGSGLADELHEQLDRYRGAMTTALERVGNSAPQATTLVVLAALDGLVLQKRLDPTLRINDALALLHTLISRKEE